MTIEERIRLQYAKVFRDWRIDGGMIGRGSQGKTAVFKITKENSGFTETGALKIINIYEAVLNGVDDPLEEIEKEIVAVKRDAEKELAAMNRMKGHANIVSYHEFAFEEYRDVAVRGVDLLIRMDYLENIGDKVRGGTLFSETEIIRMGRDLSRALAECHHKGILHRDIKPDNIFRNEYGYLLGDFGIAKYSEENDLVASTRAGSYPYAAPEQLRLTGNGDEKGAYDFRVDIYALGLSLYELANDDKIPFATSTCKRAEDIRKRLSGMPLPGLPSVSSGLEAVILKACAYQPEDRFQTAEEMLHALESLPVDNRSQKPGVSSGLRNGCIDKPETRQESFSQKSEISRDIADRGKNRSLTFILAAAVLIAFSVLAAVTFSLKKNGEKAPEPLKPEPDETAAELSSPEQAEEKTEDVIPVEADSEEKEDHDPEQTGHQDDSLSDNTAEKKIVGTLKADPYNGQDRDHELQDQKVFGSNYKRQDISEIEFMSRVPDREDKGFDVSEEEDGSILAWFDDDGGGYSRLTIAADGLISLPENSRHLFGGYENAKYISFHDCIDTSRVTDMYSMFSNCKNLKAIEGLERFDTSSVMSMYDMFAWDQALEKLDLSGFDTSHVSNMRGMFYCCVGLSELKIDSFNTENVIDMSYLFAYCQRLREPDISHFNTANVEYINNMFDYCTKVTSLNVSGFDTKKAKNMRGMFSNCKSLNEISGLGNFKTANVTDMSYMFYKVPVSSLAVGEFDTAAVTLMDHTFDGCSNLRTLDLRKWRFPSLTSAESMFDQCENLHVVFDQQEYDQHFSLLQESAKGEKSSVDFNFVVDLNGV